MPMESQPPTDAPECLYSVLGLSKDATTEAIKRSYYKLALKLHPDRCASGEDTTAAFQRVGRAYEVLSDSAKRHIYDETGVVEDGNNVSDWSNYFRELFHKVSFADLDLFKAAYIGSVEEYEDVLSAYMQHRGDIGKISESVFFGEVDSEVRFLEMIKRAINKNIVPAYEAMTKIISDAAALRVQQRKRRKRAESEAVEAARMAKEMGLHDEGDLAKTIQARQKGRYDNLISNLESKYAAPAKKSKKAASK